MGEVEARALEMERATPPPSTRKNADELWFARWLRIIEGDAATTTPERQRLRRAMKRKAKALKGNGTWTGLFVRLVDSEAASRGIR